MTIDIDAIRKLADAADSGPWRVVEEHGRDIADEAWSRVTIQTAIRYGESREIAEIVDPDHDWASKLPEENAAFLAAARTLVPALCDEVEQTRATANVRQGQLQQSRKQAAALADEVGRLTAKVAGRDKNIEQQHAENARLRRHIDALEQQLATQQPVINAANAWRWSGDTADGHRRATEALMVAIDAQPTSEVAR